MKGLIIVSHGSRIDSANNEMLQLTQDIKRSAAKHFTAVEHAFIEIAGPDFSEQVTKLEEKGVDHIIVFPLFLAAGKHVKMDIPRIVEEAQQSYPRISFQLKNHLGGLDRLADLILNHVI